MGRRECEHGYFLGEGCDACAEYERSHRAETSLNLEVISLRAELNAIEASLEPMGARYLDPPDGGDVSTSEQVRRMAEDVTRLRLGLDESDRLIHKFIEKFFPAATNYDCPACKFLLNLPD